MTVSRLKCFYLANKTLLDTRIDLAVTLLTLITREVSYVKKSEPQLSLNAMLRLRQKQRPIIEPFPTNYSEFDVLDEQLVASVQQISLKNSNWRIQHESAHQMYQQGVSLPQIRYESNVFVDQSRW